jgi:hypothetical protein
MDEKSAVHIGEPAGLGNVKDAAAASSSAKKQGINREIVRFRSGYEHCGR